MSTIVRIALRNTSGEPLDAAGLTFADVNTGEQIGTPTGGIFAPGQEGHFTGGDGELEFFTVLLGVGEGENSRVASITVSALIDHVRSLCRFNAQAIVSSVRDE
jgi:hypothetical protein